PPPAHTHPTPPGQTKPLPEGDRRTDAPDRKTAALRNEMELRKPISRNSLLPTLERQGARNQDNRLQQTSGSEDQGFGRMGQTQPKGAN
ncbi:integrating conjugative element protein, partial [Erwinia amylovora]